MKNNNFGNNLEKYMKRFALLASTTVLMACVGNMDSTSKKDTVHEADSIEEVVVTGARVKTEQKLGRSQELNKHKIRMAQKPVLAEFANIDSAAHSVGVIPQSSPPSKLVPNSAPLNYDIADNYLPENDDNYADVEESSIKRVDEDPVSTFSVDVDTGSYTNVRRMLNDGYLPPEDAVRVEEFINYFNYDYKTPRNTKEPFLVNTELSQTPWNAESKLLRIAPRCKLGFLT